MRLLLAALALLLTAGAADAASLLPPGKNCFFDANGDPLAAGKVSFFIPSTTTPKSTWQNSAQTISNTNPVNLDSAGCAVIYGSGVYRQLVKDVLGNTIWDQQTADPGASGVSWGGPSSGTGNDIAINAGGFALIDGQMISWQATATNTGPMTIDPGIASGPLPLVKDTINGPNPMVGGEVHAGNVASAVYSAADASFHLVAPPFPTSGSTANIVGQPGGRLTLDVNNPVMAGNVTAVGTIYYAPFIGATIPIWNGGLFAPYTFTQLQMNINPTDHPANKMFDLFVIEDGTVERLCTGPAWTSDTVRSLSIGYQQGIQVNSAAMPCRWNTGTAWKNIAQYEGTFVGTVRTDTTAGVTSWTPDPNTPAGAGPDQRAELYLWNNYNRVAVRALVVDATASYPSTTGTTTDEARNDPKNRVQWITGGLTDVIVLVYKHRASTPATAGVSCKFGLGLDWVAGQGYANNIFAEISSDGAVVTTASDSITNIFPAQLGLHYAQAIESSAPAATCTYRSNGVLQALLRM